MRSALPWLWMLLVGCAPILFLDDDDVGDDDVGDDDTGDDDTGDDDTGDDDTVTPPPPWDDDDWPSDDDDVADDDDATTPACGDWLATPLGALVTDLPATLQGVWLTGQAQYAWGIGELRLTVPEGTFSFSTVDGWIWNGWDGDVRMFVQVDGDGFVFAAEFNGWNRMFALRDLELPDALQAEWGLAIEPLWGSDCPWLEDACVWRPLPLRITSSSADSGAAWSIDVAPGQPVWSPDGLYYIEPRAGQESLDVSCMGHHWGIALSTPAWDG